MEKNLINGTPVLIAEDDWGLGMIWGLRWPTWHEKKSNGHQENNGCFFLTIGSHVYASFIGPMYVSGMHRSHFCKEMVFISVLMEIICTILASKWSLFTPGIFCKSHDLRKTALCISSHMSGDAPNLHKTPSWEIAWLGIPPSLNTITIMRTSGCDNPWSLVLVLLRNRNKLRHSYMTLLMTIQLPSDEILQHDPTSLENRKWEKTNSVT